MIDLGTLGGSSTYAVGVNDSGAVIGVADAADSAQRAFFWSPQSGMFGTGTVGGRNSVPTEINEAGVVVGNSETANRHAFAWSARMGLVDLGPIGWSSAALSINARGQIVGYMSHPAGGLLGRHAVIWEASGNVD
jgi:probable HAF family extracellular repeat protein